MCYRLKWLVFLLLLSATFGVAEDRVAVLEFFGRPNGAYCSAAGPAMTTLQREMLGRAVLLEYDYDGFLHGRQDRFWAAGVSAMYLPLVMVGSGYRTSSGSVSYESVYRSMIDHELARPARAEVSAFWRRSGNTMRAYIAVLNLGDTPLEIDQEGAIWLIAFENASIGVSTTWVRSTSHRYLPFDLAPGESATAVIDTLPMSGVDWSMMAGLVIIEDQTGGGGSYDMAQAAEALPAGLTAVPDNLILSSSASWAEVALTGPHVLSWTASSDVSWIEVTPTAGDLPANPTVTVRPELAPTSGARGVVTFSATGDGMDFSTTVNVNIGARLRRGGRRVVPVR
jgi:hypothetical protein